MSNKTILRLSPLSLQGLSYALPSLLLAPLGIGFYVFVPKLYSDLGTVGLRELGLVILFSRLWDAITDPLIGLLSDSSRSRWGRRKPWLFLSVLPLCVAFAALFYAPLIPADWHLFYFAVWSFLFFLFWTAYAIPYESMGPELVRDYHERTKLFVWRDGAFILGTLLAATVPLIAEFLLKSYSSWERWRYLSFLYSALLLLFTAQLLFFLPHSFAPDSFLPGSKAKPLSLLKRFRDSLSSTLSNSHFRKLLSAYLISSFGAALPATLFLFYVESVLGSERGPLFLGLYFGLGLFALPLWAYLARRYGKKEAWLAALLVNVLGFSAVFFLQAGQENLYMLFVSISALGYGASLALPSSMQADVIDSEELISGKRKEGEFLGVWSFAKKTAAALGAGAALWLLESWGFKAGQTQQTAESLLGLRVLYCLIPCLCSLASMYLIRNYALGKAEHEAITEQLTKKAQQKVYD